MEPETAQVSAAVTASSPSLVLASLDGNLDLRLTSTTGGPGSAVKPAAGSSKLRGSPGGGGGHVLRPPSPRAGATRFGLPLCGNGAWGKGLREENAYAFVCVREMCVCACVLPPPD